MQDDKDIVLILGAALEARGLTPEEGTSLIRTIDALLKASNYYVTREKHEEELNNVGEILAYNLELVEEYQRREKHCVVGGCIDSHTTKEVFLPALEGTVYLCAEHADRGEEVA